MPILDGLEQALPFWIAQICALASLEDALTPATASEDSKERQSGSWVDKCGWGDGSAGAGDGPEQLLLFPAALCDSFRRFSTKYWMSQTCTVCGKGMLFGLKCKNCKYVAVPERFASLPNVARGITRGAELGHGEMNQPLAGSFNEM